MSKVFGPVMAAAALLLAIGTVIGAGASHGLEARLDAASLSTLQTGVDYQLLHSLGILALAVHGARQNAATLLAVSVLVLLAGVVLFCSGVYASALGAPYVVTLLAPIGGTSLIVGWFLAAVSLLKQTKSN